MTNTAMLEAYETLTIEIEQPVVEQAPLSTEPVFSNVPARQFPCKHVHAIFADARDARQAALSLHKAGIDEKDICLMDGRDYVEAISQGQSPSGFLTSMDYDLYLREASRGRSFLAVRPTAYSQLTQIRTLLAPHRARHANYFDRWTVAQLLP
jgi:hypothetical protein